MNFLKDKRTKKALTVDCIAGVIKLAQSIVSKESYFAFHKKKCVTNSMDSFTTSPVESQNNIIHNHLGINSSMNAEKGIAKISEYSEQQYALNEKEGIQSLNKTNLSSRAPTKEFIIDKSQAIADQNYDASHDYSYCQIGRGKWLVWHFHHLYVGRKVLKFPYSELPTFCRVRIVELRKCGSMKFLDCSCQYYRRLGIPCTHLFTVVKQMDLNMFHIRHYKIYDIFAHKDDSKLSNLLVESQVCYHSFQSILFTICPFYLFT